MLLKLQAHLACLSSPPYGLRLGVKTGPLLLPPDVRYWHKADFLMRPANVRFQG